MDKFFSYFKNEYISLGLALVITFLAYSNSLQNGFVIEDDIYILNWPLTQNFVNIPKMFAGDTAPTGNYGVYRPMRAVFYSISYGLFGSNSALYHIQALLVHLIITALIFLISFEILKKVLSRQDNNKLNFFSFISALLFGLHPVHTEAVDYLTANFDLIGAIFYFGAFYLYIISNKKYLIPNLKMRITYPVAIVSSYFLGLIAFFTFEMTLTLPVVLVLYDFIFEKEKFKKINQYIKTVSPYFILAFVYLLIRVVLLNLTVRGEYLGGSIYFTFLTMLKVILKYFEWLIFPLNLSINPILPGGISAWNHPLSHPERIIDQSVFEPAILFSIAIISALILLAFYSYKKYPLVTFSIGWFFISILPVLDIIPQGTIFQERYIYIASFGFVILVSWLAGFLYTYKWRSDIKQIVQLPLIAFLIFITVFFGARTFFRNKDWKDSLALWSKLAKDSPEDVIGNFQTARLYKDLNSFDPAVYYYNKTLSIEPSLFEVHYALGEIYLREGKVDQSMKYFQNALKINPGLNSAKNVIRNKNLIIESTNSAVFKSGFNFIDYHLPSGHIFSFPFDWEIKKEDEKTILNDPNRTFQIEFTEDLKPAYQTPEDFIKEKSQEYGKLLGEGLVQAQNFDFAYVKQFQDKNEVKFLFFLFKDENVIEALVYPGNSSLMNTFNQIILSFRLEN